MTESWVDLVLSFKSWAFWAILLIVAAFGVLGSWAHRLAYPEEDKRVRPNSFVVGAVAALAVLFVLGPSDPIKLVALAVVAGYGGKSVLDALEYRIKAALAAADAANAREQGRMAVASGREAIEAGRNAAAEVRELLEAVSRVPVQEASSLAVVRSRSAGVLQTASEAWTRAGVQLDLLDAGFKK